jgi:hypothetical protein
VFFKIKYALEGFRKEIVANVLRQIVQAIIDESKPWGFFDGDSNGNPGNCRAGGILYLFGHHSVSFSCGSSMVLKLLLLWFKYGSKIVVEIKGVLLLVEIVVKRDDRNLQIFGDS